MINIDIYLIVIIFVVFGIYIYFQQQPLLVTYLLTIIILLFIS